MRHMSESILPPAAQAAAGPRFTAVVVVSFGGPEGRAEVMPFLHHVTAGRQIPPERLEQVAQQYYALGGVSPLNAQNRELVARLAESMSALGVAVPVRLANRHSPEFLFPVLQELAGLGHRRVLAVATSGYSSYPGCRVYREEIAAAAAEVEPAITVVKAPPLLGVPGFVSATAARLLHALSEYPADAGPPHLLFTTHSIPAHDAHSSGPPPHPRHPGEYVSQHLQAGQAVVAASGYGRALSWELVYQSRSGNPRTPWLEPDINDRLRELAADGVRDVVVLPLGFCSDHMEVIWDLDHQAASTAREVGIRMVRVPTVGTHPEFVAGLARSIVDLINPGESMIPAVQGSPDGLCGPGCCTSPNPAAASCSAIQWQVRMGQSWEIGA